MSVVSWYATVLFLPFSAHLTSTRNTTPSPSSSSLSSSFSPSVSVSVFVFVPLYFHTRSPLTFPSFCSQCPSNSSSVGTLPSFPPSPSFMSPSMPIAASSASFTAFSIPHSSIPLTYSSTLSFSAPFSPPRYAFTTPSLFLRCAATASACCFFAKNALSIPDTSAALLSTSSPAASLAASTLSSAAHSAFSSSAALALSPSPSSTLVWRLRTLDDAVWTFESHPLHRKQGHAVQYTVASAHWHSSHLVVSLLAALFPSSSFPFVLILLLLTFVAGVVTVSSCGLLKVVEDCCLIAKLN